LDNPKQWLKTRQKLLKAIQSQVQLLLGSESSDLNSYTKAYTKEFKSATHWAACTFSDLMGSMLKTQLVLGGDFHAFSQSQRAHLRILRNLPIGAKVILAMECFFSVDQKSVDAFVAGELSEKQFLKKVQWDKKWSFPWEHYRPLLQLAQARGFQVLALNKFYTRRNVDTLKKRDAHAADLIYKTHEKYADHLIYSIYGDLHLASSHLPASLRRRFRQPRLPLTVVFQDSEELYFKVVEAGLETEVEILAGGKDRFCVLGSPPWVKWQSYLVYLEHTYDRDLEEDDDDGRLDFTDHIHALVQILVSDLNVNVSTSDLAVYTAADENFLRGAQTAQSVRDCLESMISHDRSFYWAEQSVLYLSRFSINHAAGLAGTYLHFKLMNANRSPFRFPEDFVTCIWVEAVSFFFSKWINHKRKADSLREIQAQFRVDAKKEQAGREALLLAIEQRMKETSYLAGGNWQLPGLNPKETFSYFEAARMLGSSLGDKMYTHFKSGLISRDELLTWLSTSTESNDFLKTYWQVLRRFEGSFARAQELSS
jgi:hypothetical protein